MKKRKKYITAMIIIITTIQLLFIFGVEMYIKYYFTIKEVPFCYDGTITIEGNTSSPLTFYYAPTEDRLLFWLGDYRARHNLQPVIDSPDLSTYDFERYDYLLFSGRKLKRLYYSPYLTDQNDECHYLEETPLMTDLEEASLDSMYIYRIDKTTEFRAPCP